MKKAKEKSLGHRNSAKTSNNKTKIIILTIIMSVLQKDIEENGEPESTVIPYWRCQPYIRSVSQSITFTLLTRSSVSNLLDAKQNQRYNSPQTTEDNEYR